MEYIRRFPDHLEVAINSLHHPEYAYFQCDLDDEPLLRNKCYLTPQGYVGVRVDGRLQLFHRLKFDAIPEGTTVDHIDRNRLNNRRSNLRLVSKEIQSRNKVGRAAKQYPPGIQSQREGDYVVTWTDLHLVGGGVGAKEAVQGSLSFVASKYGRRGALKAAMSARMLKLISSPEYVAALFPVDLVNRALVEKNAPPLDARARPEAVGVALGVLRELGYNLWNIPYGGQFAHYMEKEDWSFKDTRKYVLRSVSDILDRLEGALSGEELREECVRLESDIRAVNALYTIFRRKEEHRRKPLAKEMVGALGRIDEALAVVRTDTQPSMAVAPAPVSTKPPPIRTMVEAAMTVMKKVGTGGREAVRKEVEPEEVEAEAEDTTAAVVGQAMKLMKAGGSQKVQETMSRALRALERKEGQDEERKKRVFKVSDATLAWIHDHVAVMEGRSILASDLVEAHARWMAASGVISPDGPNKLYYALSEAGFVHKERRTYINCSLH